MTDERGSATIPWLMWYYVLSYKTYELKTDDRQTDRQTDSENIHTPSFRTKKKQNCKNFVHLLNIKNCNKYIAQVFVPFTKYLAEAPLQSQLFFFFDVTSFAHQHLAIICHSSSHLFTSQALSGWMGQTHMFRFLQKYLIGFKLWLWMDHSRTFTELSINHSCCVFRFLVLLEGEPSAKSEDLNALD